MAERVDKTFARLSPASTELLIQRAISPSVVDRVEQELKAYFHFDQRKFGGVPPDLCQLVSRRGVIPSD